MQGGRGNTQKRFKMEESLFLFEPGKQSYLVGQQKKQETGIWFFSIARTGTWLCGQDIALLKKIKI